jgi:hypothetical protein
MSEYLITPFNETDWSLDPAFFSRRLTDQWPSAETRPGATEQAAVDFQVSEGLGSIEGYLMDNGRAVGLFVGPIALVAEIASWFRSLAPDTVDLIAMQKPYEDWVHVRPGDSPADIAHELFGADMPTLPVMQGAPIWADGFRPEDAYILEALYIGDPDASPLVPGSSAPDHVRVATLARLADMLLRYRRSIIDPTQPPRGVELIVSEERALPLLEQLMEGVDVPGHAVYRPEA